MDCKWLTADDIASLLQISRSYAYEIIKEFKEKGGTVWQPSKRVTRVNPEEFSQFIKERK